MPQPLRQKASYDVPDFAQDAQLFPSGIVQITAEVTPQRRRTKQGDLILRGFIQEKEIEVVFPGHRSTAAAPLLQKLQANIHQARHESTGSASNLAALSRLKLKIDGVWRVRLLTEQQGMPERRFQFIAARWRFRGSNGVEQAFGYMPGD